MTIIIKTEGKSLESRTQALVLPSDPPPLRQNVKNEQRILKEGSVTESTFSLCESSSKDEKAVTEWKPPELKPTMVYLKRVGANPNNVLAAYLCIGDKNDVFVVAAICDVIITKMNRWVHCL